MHIYCRKMWFIIPTNAQRKYERRAKNHAEVNASFCLDSCFRSFFSMSLFFLGSSSFCMRICSHRYLSAKEVKQKITSRELKIAIHAKQNTAYHKRAANVYSSSLSFLSSPTNSCFFSLISCASIFVCISFKHNEKKKSFSLTHSEPNLVFISSSLGSL